MKKIIKVYVSIITILVSTSTYAFDVSHCPRVELLKQLPLDQAGTWASPNKWIVGSSQGAYYNNHLYNINITPIYTSTKESALFIAEDFMKTISGPYGNTGRCSYHFNNIPGYGFTPQILVV